DTLSGGELQRARLATQLSAGLVGVCYVLDEPTAGLHPRDTDQLIASLRRLQAQGNSMIVVEHDEAVIRAADWAVDLARAQVPTAARSWRPAGPSSSPTWPGRSRDATCASVGPNRPAPGTDWKPCPAGSSSAMLRNTISRRSKRVFRSAR